MPALLNGHGTLMFQLIGLPQNEGMHKGQTRKALHKLNRIGLRSR